MDAAWLGIYALSFATGLAVGGLACLAWRGGTSAVAYWVRVFFGSLTAGIIAGGGALGVGGSPKLTRAGPHPTPTKGTPIGPPPRLPPPPGPGGPPWAPPAEWPPRCPPCWPCWPPAPARPWDGQCRSQRRRSSSWSGPPWSSSCSTGRGRTPQD